MVGNALATFGHHMGWHLIDDALYGLYKQYPVMVRQRLLLGRPRLETIRLKTRSIPLEQRQAILQALRALPFSGRFTRHRITSSAIHLRYRPLYKLGQAPLTLSAVQGMIEVADAFGLWPEQAVSPSPAAIRRAFFTGEADTMLGAADVFEFPSLQYSPQGRRMAFARSYAYGWAGGSLYALVGVVPTVAAAYLLDPLPGVVGLVISYLCYYGYRQFNGLAGRLTNLNLLAMSLLWVLITVWGSSVVQRIGKGRSWNEVWQLTTEYSSSCIIECGVALGSGLVASLLLAHCYKSSARRFRQTLSL